MYGGVKLRWRPEQSAELEWMDAPGHSRALIEDNLGDLRRVNRLLGGVRLTLRPLLRLAAALPPAQRLCVLDVATGGADIPRAIASWSLRSGRPLFLVASDINFDIAAVARDHSRLYSALQFVVADACHLPFAGDSFHVAVSSLALHHLSPDRGEQMLRELGRCATLGVVINDIVRRWIGYCGAIVAVTFGSRNLLTRHDGPLSVLRAFTGEEMVQLARRAGLRPVYWESFLFYRVAMTAGRA